MEVNLHKALEKIRQWVGDRKAKSYTRKGCKLSLANLKSKPANRVVLDVDRAYPPSKAKKNQCDFILFHIDDAQISFYSITFSTCPVSNERLAASVTASVLNASLYDERTNS